MSVVAMTDEQRAEVEAAQRRTGKVRHWKRSQAILLRGAGTPVQMVAQALGGREASVTNWTTAWRTQGVGGVSEGLHRGAAHRLDLAAEQQLAKLLLTRDNRARYRTEESWRLNVTGPPRASSSSCPSANNSLLPQEPSAGAVWRRRRWWTGDRPAMRDETEDELPVGRDTVWAETADEPATPRQDGAIAVFHRTTDDDQSGAGQALMRTWRQELPRWLATLNSQRTRREYEKAVLYFFLAPGVPETLADLTFDLLLAYRGSLALRADRQRSTTTGRPSAGAPWRRTTLTPGGEPLLPTGADPGADPAEETGDEADRDRETSGEQLQGTSATGPLAPATVNVRLTALGQFLAHCSLWGLLPQLAPERIHAALRRLRIERRRPYQILAEPEWASFLTAARAPAVRAPMAATPASGDTPEPDSTAEEAGLRGGQNELPLSSTASFASSAAHLSTSETPDSGDAQIGVWGIPRSVRRRLAATQTAAGDGRDIGAGAAMAPAGSRGSAATRAGAGLPRRVRSRAGLTGARTAQRDHALLALALATGLRAIELCALDLGDLTREWHAGREEWWLVLPDAKTKGQRGGRTLPLAAALVQTLFDYVRSTGRQWESVADRGTPLFLSRRRAQLGYDVAHSHRATRHRLSTEQVRRIVDRVETQWIASGAGTSAGRDVAGAGDGRAISPHALRHSTAVALLEGNERSGRPPASVEHVRGWLGHFDIRTTQGYLAHLDARRNRRPFALQPAEEAAPAMGNSGTEPTPPTDKE